MDKNEINLLVKQIRDGDEYAFDKLYRGMYKPLFRYIYGKVPDTAAVKDILQNTFMIVVEKCKEKVLYINCFSWIYTIAHNLAVNYIRKKVRETKADAYDKPAQVNVLPLDTDGKIGLKMAVSKLDKDERSILMMKYLDDLTFRELALMYKTSQTSIKRKVFRIIDKLQRDIS